MQTNNLDLEITKGETKYIRLFWYTTSDGGVTKTPVDVSAYNASMTIRKVAAAEEAIATVSHPTNIGLDLVDLGGGVKYNIQVKIPPAKTSTLHTGVLYYDLKLTAPNGDVGYLVRGSITVYEAATR